MNKGLSKERILVVDDDKSIREFLEIFFIKEGYKVNTISNGKDALEFMDKERVSLVLSDIRMPGMDGITFLKEIKKRYPEVPVVMITAFGNMETAVAAMKEGAWDYISKPFKVDHLREVVHNAIQKGPDIKEFMDEDERKIFVLDKMVTRSPAMLKIFQLIPKISSSPSNVLISGESGTGKELVARAIHNLGDRKDKPFITVNCGGIPEQLLESEFFGYKKGAFTGADRNKPGLFAQANKGTIFLDEIGEVPLNLQVKLLRVVQQKSFIPVGSEKEVHVDVRIISATNRDLEKEVMEGKFREDLYYRLNVIHIHVPPLRERCEDIPILIQHFFDRYAKEHKKKLYSFSSFALEALLNYSFPGNVRELENIIERSLALSTSSLILPESLTMAKFKDKKNSHGSTSLTPDEQLDAVMEDLYREGINLDEYLSEIEKKLITKALEATYGNKTEAAALLGLNFRSFRYRLDKYGL